MCGLLESATLFKMRHSIKINIAAKVFQKSIMICIFNAIKMSWIFRVYDQGVVPYEQNKLGLSGYYDKRYVLADGIHTRPLDF